jgi:hypothetical protein
MGNCRLVLIKIRDSKPEQFLIAFLNVSATQGEPFMRTSEPKSEVEIRIELAKMGHGEAEVKSLIQQARKNPL